MSPFIPLSASRAESVFEEISAGSDPHLRFHVLLVASAMIACFGLAANSSAVIIGAMLVSPLMMPIFGIALGMLQGNPQLMGRALIAETGGAILAIGAAYGVGLLQLTAGEATSEMLSRTQPNLIDLLVAIFAGFAGAYAMVDERISPALPGVAIATAIVPPLSTCGLCLSLGAWSGAAGALLLFLANFVSILIVALLTFWMAGLAQPGHAKSWKELARRFAPAVSAFLIVSIILTNSLMRIMQERFTKNTIRRTLVSELISDQAADLEEFDHYAESGRIQVLAMVRSPRIIKPARVKEIQNALKGSLEAPVDLVVRTVLSKDVTPTDSSLVVTKPDLDGSFLTARASDSDAKETLAEQVIREQFEEEPGFELTNLEYGTSPRGEGVVLAYVDTIRRLRQREIEALELDLRERMDDARLTLLLRVNSGCLEFSKGPVRVEWTTWRGAAESEIVRLPVDEKKVREVVAGTLQVIPTHVHFNIRDGRRQVLVEVVGPRPLSPQDAQAVQHRLDEELDTPTTVHLWYRNEFVVNSGGYTTYEGLSDPELEMMSQHLRNRFGSEDSSEAGVEEVTKIEPSSL